MNDSFLKLYRKSLGSAVFASDSLWRLWSYLLMSANYAERQLPDGTTLQPGQMVRGVRRIAADLKWAKSKAERHLQTLKRLKNIEITRRPGTLAQIISICQWETYQGDRDTNRDTSGDTSRDTSGDKKKKETKKEKKSNARPTLDEVRTYCKERQNAIDPERFFSFYQANGWVQGRAGKPIKDWKACVITWEKNNYDKERKHGQTKRTSPGHTHDPDHPCKAI